MLVMVTGVLLRRGALPEHNIRVALKTNKVITLSYKYQPSLPARVASHNSKRRWTRNLGGNLKIRFTTHNSQNSCSVVFEQSEEQFGI